MTDKQKNTNLKGNLSDNGDNCRNSVIDYIIKTGGRKLDKPKLNFRFHNPNTPEELTKILLRVCIDANMKKVEHIIREEAAVALDENGTGDKNEYSGILQSIDG